MNSTPAPGWYADPAGSPQQRWWNGSSWSDSLQAAPAASPYGAVQPYGAAQPYQPMQSYPGAQQQYSYYGQTLGAPEGTDPSTLQSWVIAGWPLLGLLTLPIYASLGGFDASTSSAYTMADFVNLALGALLWFAFVVVAYLDYRELQNRQVAKPFHWAFALIPWPIVYVIGRSVVAYSRTRRGLAPLFVWIGASVLSFIISFVLGLSIAFSSVNELYN
jgi:hypothetical protein